ncbi:MAG: hypothetical protein IKQ91_07865 [Oscillospiraceae bacterium]|nr:hypothetical protein [Oscillospiraceae bacterium]
MNLMKKLTAAAAAVLMLSAQPLSASAADIMNFRVSAEKNAFTVDDVAKGDQVVRCNLYIDNYTGLSQFRLILKGTQPLVIENGDYTRIPDQIGPDKKPQLAFFKKYSSAVYTQYNEETELSNYALWYGEELGKSGGEFYGQGELNDPNSSLIGFDVRIPKDTPPGDYVCGVSTEVKHYGTVIEEDFFAYQNRRQLVYGEEVTTTPVTFSVYRRGDIDCEDGVALRDAQLALMFYTQGTLTHTVFPDTWYAEKVGSKNGVTAQLAADASGDGKIGLDDAQGILRYYTQSMGGLKPDWNEIF